MDKPRFIELLGGQKQFYEDKNTFTSDDVLKILRQKKIPEDTLAEGRLLKSISDWLKPDTTGPPTGE